MGQSVTLASPRLAAVSRRSPVATLVPCISVFPTELGWFGLLGADSSVCGLVIGHASEDEVRRAAGDLGKLSEADRWKARDGTS